jgi:iron complex transport system ATP-binding protein
VTLVSPLMIEDVYFSYGPARVVNGVCLEVLSGEMLGIVGPNGSGKTTFLDLVTGILKPLSGHIQVGGLSLGLLSPKERAKRVAMVPQNPVVPQGFTALQVVLMGRNPHLGLLEWESSHDLEVAQRVMELTDTWKLAQRMVASLSGGERQRVFIARSLAQETPILLLDEPTAHLDIGYQSIILDLVHKIRLEMGVTVLVAMHDLSLAGQYCGRIAVLHQGVIHALGCPKEVINAEMVWEVFGSRIVVIQHPVHNTPVVLPIGGPVKSSNSIAGSIGTQL